MRANADGGKLEQAADFIFLAGLLLLLGAVTVLAVGA